MTTRAKEIRELGNTGYLEVDANGNVGIGDASPSEKLNVAGNIMLEGSDQFMYLSNVGTGNSGIYVRGISGSTTLRSHSTGIFTWEVLGSEKMRLDSSGQWTMPSSGRVGIGISNPSANFDVRPSRTDTDPLIALFANQASGEDTRVMISTIANQSGDPYIKFDSGGSNMIVGQFWQGTSNNQLKLGVGERPSDGNFKGITVNGSGNVGIGTSSPSVNLHVEGNIKSNSGFMINPQTININTTVASDENASITGPITVEADLIINGNLTVI